MSWVWLKFSAFDSYISYFKENSLPLPSYKIILPLSLKVLLDPKGAWLAQSEFGVERKNKGDCREGDTR